MCLAHRAKAKTVSRSWSHKMHACFSDYPSLKQLLKLNIYKHHTDL